MAQLTPTPSHSRPSSQPQSGQPRSSQAQPGRTLTDEMPDPDNLHIDRSALMTLPIQLPPAPAIGERLVPARHRAEYSRSA